MYTIRQKNELCGKILKHNTLSWLCIILLDQEMLCQEAVNHLNTFKSSESFLETQKAAWANVFVSFIM